VRAGVNVSYESTLSFASLVQVNVKMRMKHSVAIITSVEASSVKATHAQEEQA
jgi:hypothetical protein